MPPPLFSVSPAAMMSQERRIRATQDWYAETVMPISFAANDDDFTYTVSPRPFGPVVIGDSAGSAMEMWSDRADAVNNRPFLLYELVTEGSGYCSAWDGYRDVRAGDSLVLPSTQPFHCGTPDRFRSRFLIVTEAALADTIGDLDRLPASVLPGHLPEAGILKAYLSAVDLADPESEDPAFRNLVGSQLLDLLSSALSRGMGLKDPTEGRGARAVRFTTARRIVDRELDRPTLSAATLGRRLGVTERTVQKMFEDIGTTCSSYIAEKRMQKAYGLLTDPALVTVPVRILAERVGFTDPATFTRAFRRRFGETPMAVRGTAIPPGGTDDRRTAT
jgi:AraC-like DNA-binding protein